MDSGSGTLAATAVMAASSLACEFGGGIVGSRIRPAEPSLSVVFGKPNKAMQQTIGAPTTRAGSDGW
jgi:hypothetical protein